MKTNFKHKCWYLVILALLVTSQATADTATFSWVSGGTMTSATGTQGQITLTGAANSASGAPGVTSNTLRLYAHRSSGNGASATFTASSGYQITAFTVTSSNGGTILKYGINGATPSTTFSWSSGSSTISNLTANSFTLKNCQNSGNSNTTIQIASVVITYESTSSSCTDPAMALSISSANTATVGTNLSLTSSGGNGETVTWTVANGTGSATVSGSTLTPTGAGTVTVTATQPDGVTYCGATVNQSITISQPAATITLNNYSGSATTTGFHSGDSFTLPSTNSYTCDSKTFVGWSTVEVATTDTKPSSNYYEPGASVTLGVSNTFYAVFATASGGGSSSGSATLVSSSSSTYYSSGYITGVSGNNCATWTTDAFTMTQNKNNSSSAVSLSYAEIRVYASHSLVFSPASGTEITSIVVTANSEGYATALGGSSTSNCTKSVSSSTVTITPSDGTEDITLTNSAQSRINSLVVNYTTGGGTTYSAYATSCCTALGAINGSVNWSNPTTAVVTWNKLADQVTSWALSWSPNTAGSSITSAIADAGGGTQKTATVSGLACGTEYTFTVTPTVKSGVCTPASNPTIVSTSTKYSITRSGSPAGTVTGGTFTTKISGSAVTEACNSSTIDIVATPSTGYEFSSWTIISKAGGGTVKPEASSASTTFTMPSDNVTVTAAFSCITPTFGTNLTEETVNYLTGGSATALTVAASAGGATINYQWQTKVGEGAWTDTGTNAPENTSLTPSTAGPGTTQYRCIATNAAAGCSSATATSHVVTVVVTNPSGYCISAFNSSNNGITGGFSNGGSGNHYTLSYTIPGKDGSSNWPQYWVGENEAWASSFSANATFADMPLMSNYSATLGLAEGATGTLHIWNDNIQASSNLFIKFEPSGYGLRWGGAGEWNQAANTKAFTVDPGDANVYWTDIVTLDGTNNTTWNYYVGLQTASGYIYSGVDNEASDSRGISRTGSVTAMKVSNGTNGSFKATYLNSEPTNSRGKFRIWINNISAYNFVCHWVPFYRVTYNGNGASGSVAASADVCCEGNAAARTVKAAANGFTAATGKQFAGWATSAGGAKVYDPNDDIVLTADVVLYPVWEDIDYTVTVNQSPSVGATTTGQTTTAHYNGTINLTTTVPSGYRFVNWTTTDGFSITNPTSATTASFTMPNKNVTVTANFQQTHKVDWYVGGSAVGNKLGDDGQTTVVDHGSKISDFPATTPDGSVCDKVFVGWTNTSSYEHGTSPLFNDVAGSPQINADASFYAVFAEVGEGDFELVTSVTQLSAGDEVTIASVAGNSQDGAVIKAYNDGSNWPEASVTTSATGTIAANTTDMQTFTLEAGTVTNSWAFYDGTGYPYAASSSSNHMKREAEKSANSSFSITIEGSTSVATIVAQGNYSHNVMQYNSSNNLFACYGSASQASVYLYKKSTSYTDYTITCADCGTSVTVSYSDPGSGNTMTVTKGSTPIASGTSVKTCSDVDLTVTLTPATHFTADDLTATGVTEVTISNVGNVYTVTIPQDATGTLTLTPTFTAETPLTITFDVPTGMGTAGTIGTIYSGDNFDFPNVTGYDSDCVDFIGWVDATSGSTFPNDGTATSEPAGLFKYNDNSGTVTTDKTYKAVYSEKVTDYAESYAKVTSSPANWANDHYLIVYEDGNLAFDGSLNTLDAVSNNVAVTITAGIIPYSTTLAASEFRIAAITGGYSIQSASGKYIGTSSDANSLESSTEAILNTLSISDGNFDAVSNSAHLRYNAASDQTRFRYYKSSTYTSQKAVQLYKYGMNEVVTYTYTTAPACGDKYFVTLASVTGGAPTASPKAAADGTTINIVANPNNGYTFTSWTITKDADDSNVTSTLLDANSTSASTSFTMPAYDVTITAAYSITDYTITYNNLNGASNTNPTSYTVATADINLTDPGERSGYVFKGWYDDAVYTNRVTTIANGSTGNISLYAKWAVGHTVTWQNGVGATNPTPTGIEDGQTVGTLPVPTGSCELNGVEYSNFVGWYTGTIADVATDPSEAGTLITSATVPNGNVTYHAVYTNMPDYSSTHTSNVTLPTSPASPVSTAKVKVEDADDAPQYDAIKIGTSSSKTGSFTFTVPAGTTRITVQGAGWSGKTTSITLATSVGTISPSTAQSLEAQSGASNNSPFTIASNTTLNFNLTGVTSSEATITLSNSGERVIVWGINASSASGSEIGYITQCCDNMMSAPVMNTPTVRTSTAITLSWNAVANATGYKVSWNGGDWEDVGTATTYAKTSLEPETDYAYKVIAKYTTPYCGATPVEGVVSTLPVYTVTYAKGTGTGSCSATGTIPAVATYEAGQVVTIVANPFTLAGNTFSAWVVKDTSDNTVAVTNGQFTMPESNVTITATWTAKQDRFFDRMHDGTDATHGGVDDGNGHYYIVREGCQYVMPTLTDDDTGTDICHTSHYKLLGWVAESHINTTDGTIKAEALDANGMVKDNLLYKPGVSVMTANNQTFYAVWAVVQ